MQGRNVKFFGEPPAVKTSCLRRNSGDNPGCPLKQTYARLANPRLDPPRGWNGWRVPFAGFRAVEHPTAPAMGRKERLMRRVFHPADRARFRHLRFTIQRAPDHRPHPGPGCLGAGQFRSDFRRVAAELRRVECRAAENLNMDRAVVGGLRLCRSPAAGVPGFALDCGD